MEALAEAEAVAEVYADLLDYSPVPLNVPDFKLEDEAQATLFMKTLWDPEAVANEFKSLEDYEVAMKATPGFEAFLQKIHQHHTMQTVSYNDFYEKVGGFKPEEHTRIYDIRYHLSCVNPNHSHTPRPAFSQDFKSFINRGGNIIRLSRLILCDKISKTDKDEQGNENFCYYNTQRGKSTHYLQFPVMLKADLAYYRNKQVFKHVSYNNEYAMNCKIAAWEAMYARVKYYPAPASNGASKHARITTLAEDRRAQAEGFRTPGGLIDDGKDILPGIYYGWQDYKSEPALLATPDHRPGTSGCKPEEPSIDVEGFKPEELSLMAQAVEEAGHREQGSYRKAQLFGPLAKIHLKIAADADRQPRQSAYSRHQPDREPEFLEAFANPYDTGRSYEPYDQGFSQVQMANQPFMSRTWNNSGSSQASRQFHMNRSTEAAVHSKKAEATKPAMSSVNPGSSHEVLNQKEAEAEPTLVDYDPVSEEEGTVEEAPVADGYQAQANGQAEKKEEAEMMDQD